MKANADDRDFGLPVSEVMLDPHGEREGVARACALAIGRAWVIARARKIVDSRRSNPTILPGSDAS